MRHGGPCVVGIQGLGRRTSELCPGRGRGEGLGRGEALLRRGSEGLLRGAVPLRRGSESLLRGSKALRRGSKALRRGGKALRRRGKALRRGSEVGWVLVLLLGRHAARFLASGLLIRRNDTRSEEVGLLYGVSPDVVTTVVCDQGEDEQNEGVDKDCGDLIRINSEV